MLPAAVKPTRKSTDEPARSFRANPLFLNVLKNGPGVVSPWQTGGPNSGAGRSLGQHQRHPEHFLGVSRPGTPRASYYLLFGVIGASNHAIVVETLVMFGFGLAATDGFKSNLWWVVVAFAAHGTLDFFHGHLIANPGMPAWWPAFCLGFDITAAAFLAWLLKRSTKSPSGSVLTARR